MKRYIAKIWFNNNAQRFFGLSDNTDTVHVYEYKEELLSEIESHYSVPVVWEHDSLTQTTRGSIEL